MIKQVAKLISIDENIIEESICLLINGIEINCFLSICDFPIVLGEEYEVLFSFSDFDVEEAEHGTNEVEKINDAYSYKITGLLEGGVLNSTFKIYDDFLESDYTYLDGSYVSLLVERLDVEILSN